MKYKIKGELTYSETNETFKIDETFEADAENCEAALAVYLDENDYEFYGSLKTYDANTSGKVWAHFYDQSEQQALNVELVK